MLSITPNTISTAQLHGYLLGCISPRPICFASTIDNEGNANLAPYSFFNVFGSNPTRLIFSPARRVRNNTIKHTLENIYLNKEVVINVVNYAMVQQMSLASCEFEKGINEFEKAGFTMLASDTVKPYRVAESPAQLECKVIEVIETGTEGGAGNLVICEILKMHINENVLNEKQQIDPNKIDLVARMGGDYYCRASGAALFEVEKPNTNLGMGVDALPSFIKNSKILTGNNLGQLGNCNGIPLKDNTMQHNIISELAAKQYLDAGNVAMAWQILLSIGI
jgi:flavin reductase (DIM6/NTAB) family NADH-FMN oxidoreductase RutF